MSNIVRDLTRINRDLDACSADLIKAATDINDASQLIATASQQQADAVSESASAVTEISSMTVSTAKDAESLGQIATNAGTSVKSGQESIDEMRQAIDIIFRSNEDVAQQVDSSNKKISGIVRVINEIGTKTKVINDIVFQTKLLSFNASVEAARAGDQGRGFSVVAEEVGNLASMSGQAAKDISTMLTDGVDKAEAILKESEQQAKQVLETGKKSIEAGVATTGRCNATFLDIFRNVNSLAEIGSQITTAVKEQSLGVQKISEAMHTFSESTQHTSTAAKKAMAIAESLLDQANVLNSTVEETSKLISGTKAA